MRRGACTRDAKDVRSGQAIRGSSWYTLFLSFFHNRCERRRTALLMLLDQMGVYYIVRMGYTSIDRSKQGKSKYSRHTLSSCACPVSFHDALVPSTNVSHCEAKHNKARQTRGTLNFNRIYNAATSRT